MLVYKNLAIFKPGGKNCIVALDKASGQTIWQSTGFDAGPEYSSCLPLTYDGTTMIVTGTRQGIVAIINPIHPGCSNFARSWLVLIRPVTLYCGGGCWGGAG